MDLKEFILDEVLIGKAVPSVARAFVRQRFSGGPPQKCFEPHPVGDNAISYLLFDDKPAGDDEGCQILRDLSSKRSLFAL
jgi:hypothetical protein